MGAVDARTAPRCDTPQRHGATRAKRVYDSHGATRHSATVLRAMVRRATVRQFERQVRHAGRHRLTARISCAARA
jgi:hypothetical protein